MSALPATIRPRSNWLLIPGALLVALFAGRVGAMESPFIAAVLIALFLAVAFYAYLGSRLSAVFLAVLVPVLMGYAFLGRGFAYFGVAPLYVGELTLALGLGAVFANGLGTRLSAVHLAILLFIAWGVVTTAPYVSDVGIDALRDAAFWYYSLFALAIWALMKRREQFERLVGIYRLLMPLFVFSIPALWIITSTREIVLATPRVPGSRVPIIDMKAGDVGVHLAGAAAFLLLGLYARSGKTRIPAALVWFGWGIGLLIVVMVNRGGFLSASVSVAALMVLRPSAKMYGMAAAAAVVFAVLLVANPSVTVSGREFSAERVTGRAGSIVDRSGERQGTVDWRLEWWGEIIGYTFHGQYFWTGKGFGADLAAEDGFLGQAFGLRSPHNATMTALARGGVPGLAVWLSVHLTFGLLMLKTYLGARRRGDDFWAGVTGWLLIYWGAGLINGSFDVYWEGPQGAIWMWTIIGLGLAAMDVQRRDQQERRSIPVRPQLMSWAR